MKMKQISLVKIYAALIMIMTGFGSQAQNILATPATYCNPINLDYGYTPVSYTHLDVYKRQ